MVVFTWCDVYFRQALRLISDQPRIVFDAPPAQVSEAMLKQLYRNDGRQVPADTPVRAAEPVAMQCR